MTIIKVLGSSSLIGKYFVDKNFDYELVCFSRKNKNHTFLDLQNKDTFINFSCENSLLVSFAPIWLVKDLIIKLDDKCDYFNLIIGNSLTYAAIHIYLYHLHTEFICLS